MNRLIIVSNRLPFALDSTGADLWTVTPAVGGLVSAVEPVLRERGGTWIGWPGTAGKIPQRPLAEATRDAGYNVESRANGNRLETIIRRFILQTIL